TIERAAVQQHPHEAEVIAGGRIESAAAVERGQQAGRLIRLLRDCTVRLAILSPVDGHEAILLGLRNVIERIGHAERNEDVIAEILLEVLTGQLLDKLSDPIVARAVHPLSAGLEEERTRCVFLALTWFEVASGGAGEPIAKPGRV